MKPISSQRKAIHTEKGVYDAQVFLPGLPKWEKPQKKKFTKFLRFRKKKIYKIFTTPKNNRPRVDIIESQERKTVDVSSMTLPRGFKEGKAR